MANYAFTKYRVEGKKESLTKIAEAINNGEGWALQSFQNLGLPYNASCRAEWETGAVVEDKEGYSVLAFTEAYPYCKSELLDEALAQLFPNEKFEIYYLSEIFESCIHETNDEKGKYFPYKCVVCTDSDDGDVYFPTVEEGMRHAYDMFQKYIEENEIKMEQPLPAFPIDAETLYHICEQYDYGFAFSEIEMVG